MPRNRVCKDIYNAFKASQLRKGVVGIQVGMKMQTIKTPHMTAVSHNDTACNLLTFSE